MSPIAARTRRISRPVATLALAAIAATGITTAVALPASAAPSPDPSFTWTSATLTSDSNANGLPDVGDVVTYDYAVALDSSSTQSVKSFSIVSAGYSAHESGLAIAPGSPESFSVDVTVGPLMLDALGGGPNLAGAIVTFRLAGPLRIGATSMAAPPVLYTAPAPLTVSTGFALTDGTPAGLLVEGDVVHYVTRVTNTNTRNVLVTGDGYDSPAGPQLLAGGAFMDFYGAPVTVTYADMVAGGVSFADTSFEWRALLMTGTESETPGTAATASVDASFGAGAKFTVHSQIDGSNVPKGDAVVGDKIDVKFDVSNIGNVTLNYVGMALNPWGAGSTTRSNDASQLAPGTSLPNGIWKPKDLNSAKGAFTPYALTATDIANGYVDVGADISVAPSRAVFDANSWLYTVHVDERVLLRNFNTHADLRFTDATLDDANGDGIGQAGETVHYRVRLANNADQALTIDTADDAAGSDVVAPIATKFVGKTVGMEDLIAKQWTYTITSADESRGTLDAGVEVGFHGDANRAWNSRTAWADTIATGPLVAPDTTLNTSATWVDANGDGLANPGDTVTVKVTAKNVGEWALTGLVVSDGSIADATGLLPAFATTLAPGTTDTHTFDYVLTGADLARGVFRYVAAMTADGLAATDSTTSVALDVVPFVAPATTLDTSATYVDANGDGHANAGETVTVTVTAKNTGTYPLTGLVVTDAAGANATGLLPAFSPTLAPGATDTHTFDYVLTAADQTRGAFYYAAAMTADGLASTTSGTSVTVSVLPYVAPVTTLSTTVTYVDTNADGFPSIGEKATFTVAVNNTGTFALTGLTVGDAAGDVMGLLPVFPTSVAGHSSAVKSFDYVLKAADFARGSLTYSDTMQADGLAATTSSATLTGITFQAYETDLDTMLAGNISVCESNGTPTDTITLLSMILVEPGTSCAYTGLPFGYRVVGFSTPMLMGTNTFSVTVPAALHVGPHRLALYAPNGTLVGWKAVTAKDPISFAGPGTAGGALAGTGVDSDEIVALGGNAALLVLLGAAFVVADSRRRRHAGR